MKSAIYLGREDVKIREPPDSMCSDNDVVIKNIYSSICGTDAAVYTHGPNTGHPKRSKEYCQKESNRI